VVAGAILGEAPPSLAIPAAPEPGTSAAAPTAAVANLVARGAEAGPEPLLEALRREVTRASRYHHGIAISVLRFVGLERLEAGERRRTRDEIAGVVQGCVRGSDLHGWCDTDALAIVAPEATVKNRNLEERLLKQLETRLQRATSEGNTHIEIRIGSSTYPRDGQDARSVLEAAAGRAH
jgi:hypothetical protein